MEQTSLYRDGNSDLIIAFIICYPAVNESDNSAAILKIRVNKIITQMKQICIHHTETLRFLDSAHTYTFGHIAQRYPYRGEPHVKGCAPLRTRPHIPGQLLAYICTASTDVTVMKGLRPLRTRPHIPGQLAYVCTASTGATIDVDKLEGGLGRFYLRLFYQELFPALFFKIHAFFL